MKEKGNGISSKTKIVFRSLKYRNYRLFFSGQSVSLIGTWMQRLALPWVVYQMTGSEVLLGIVGCAGGSVCLIGSLVFYKRLPELKKIVRPIYVKMGIIPEVASGIQTASESPAG